MVDYENSDDGLRHVVKPQGRFSISILIV